MTIAGSMDSFTLNEISLVDAAAQRPALAVIEKRSDGEWDEHQRREAAAAGVARADGSFPIASALDLEHAVEDYNRVLADKPAIRAHIVARAKALGISDRLPKEWQVEAGDGSDDDSEGAKLDKAIRVEIDRGGEIRKAVDSGVPPIRLGPSAPGWPGGSASSPGVNTKPEGRAQIGRRPATGALCDTDDPDAADPYAMPDWAAGDDWNARAAWAGPELHRRAKKIAKKEGVSVYVAHDRLMKSPAGRALFSACQ